MIYIALLRPSLPISIASYPLDIFSRSVITSLIVIVLSLELFFTTMSITLLSSTSLIFTGTSFLLTHVFSALLVIGNAFISSIKSFILQIYVLFCYVVYKLI